MKIVGKERLAQNLMKFVIESPLIADKVLPGQFILLMVKGEGERIPLTVAASDKEKKTITLIVQEVGYTTKLMSTLNVGEALYALVGPLGRPTPIKNYGKVIILGGGVGIAELLPVIAALKDVGCTITSILGGRTAELIILRDEVKALSQESIITTDDGSLGEKGLVTEPLKRLLKESKDYGLVFCVGPLPMMKAVSMVTRPYQIKTIVCLNAIMIDGTGMCGGCRLTYNGETKFCCVDGPDFDGHLVDFDELMVRQKRFLPQEEEALKKLHRCKLDDSIKKE